MVTLSAIEVCVSNAERLLLDASKTTQPTAAALAELSIEEAAKAWMLYFRFRFQGRSTKLGFHLSPVDQKKINRCIKDLAPSLEKLDEDIADAFRYHKVKLRFIGSLLKYVSVAMPIMAKKKGTLAQIAREVHGPAINVRVGDYPATVKELLKVVQAFQLDHMTELDLMKQRGFYVNLTKSGDLVSPDIEPLPSLLLMPLAAFLIITLKGDLLLLTK